MNSFSRVITRRGYVPVSALRAALIALAVAAPVLMVGGCPSGTSPDGSDNPLNLVGGPSTIAGDQEIGPGEPGASGLAVENGVFSTRRAEAVIVPLRAANASGPIGFEIVAGPNVGALSDLHMVDNTSAEVTFTPPANFTGLAEFTYRAFDDDSESPAGSVRIAVIPALFFGVTPADGPPPLNVHVYIAGDGADALVDGTLQWSFDGMIDEGPVNTHAEREWTFTGGGAHIIKLSLLVAGILAPIPVGAGPGVGGYEATAIAWPTISGHVYDPAGEPLAGVTVSVVGGGISTQTDARGLYQLVVPYGWSGQVRAAIAEAEFSPYELTFESVVADRPDADFHQLGGGSPVPPDAGNTLIDISGYVRKADGAGVAGVVLVASNSDMRATTDASGYYKISMSKMWIGRLTPSHKDYVFSPTSRDYNQPTVSVGDADYTASPANGNQAPFANDTTITLNEDTSAVISLSGLDPEGAVLIYTVHSLPAHGALRDEANDRLIQSTDLPYTIPWYGTQVRYTPAPNYFGPDSFTFSVSDGRVEGPATGLVNITVVGVNDAPVTGQQTAWVRVDTTERLRLTASDADNDPLSFVIHTLPANGTLVDDVTGTVIPAGALPYTLASRGSYVRYSPTSGYSGSDTFRFSARDASAASEQSSMLVTVAEWQPPVGIPSPSIGLVESHMMYANQTYDFGSGPQAYPNAGAGPYTHYIDNTHPNATDTNNPYGSPSKPRLTPPSALKSGSVVEIHGGPYVNALNGNGAPVGYNINAASGEEPDPARPVFVRGLPNARPKFGRAQGDNYTLIRRSYTIVENIDFDGSTISFKTPAHHMVIRDCEIHNNVAGSIGHGRPYTDDRSHDAVVLRCYIHHNGNYQTDIDEDVHGIAPGTMWNVWLLENEISYCSGDGIQVCDNGKQGGVIYPHHIYIGRNILHHNKQKGLTIKDAEDVVISQNISHSHRPMGSNPSAWGDGFGCQYSHNRVWFILNEAYNCEGGFRIGDSDAQEIYLLGNVFHDLNYSGTDPNYDFRQRTPSGAAMTLRRGAKVWACANTIYNCDAGIVTDRMDIANRSLTIRNNLISNIRYGFHISVVVNGQDVLARSDLRNNLLYQPGGTPMVRWQSTDQSGVLEYTVPQFIANFPDKGAGMLAADPRFIDAPNGNYQVQANSPAVNAGDPLSEAYARFEELYGLDIRRDFLNVARPQGAAFDIGAFER